MASVTCRLILLVASQQQDQFASGDAGNRRWLPAKRVTMIAVVALVVAGGRIVAVFQL